MSKTYTLEFSIDQEQVLKVELSRNEPTEKNGITSRLAGELANINSREDMRMLYRMIYDAQGLCIHKLI